MNASIQGKDNAFVYSFIKEIKFFQQKQQKSQTKIFLTHMKVATDKTNQLSFTKSLQISQYLSVIRSKQKQSKIREQNDRKPHFKNRIPKIRTLKRYITEETDQSKKESILKLQLQLIRSTSSEICSENAYQLSPASKDQERCITMKNSILMSNQTNSTSSGSSLLKENKRIVPRFLQSKWRKTEQNQKNSKKKVCQLQFESFRPIKKLGSGRFGNVYMVQEIATGFILALKVINKQRILENSLEQFIRELKLQSFVNHPNVIKIYSFFHDHINIYILMQLANEGHLYSLLKRKDCFSEEATSFIVRNLLLAANYLHKQGIIHRDIKPQNVVIAMGQVKICDFGWAVKKEKEQLRNTYCGTPLYLPPQIIVSQGYDEKVDLWTIGILAFELRVGFCPFKIRRKEDLHQILTEKLSFPKNKALSEQYINFIDKSLEKNPEWRYQSQQLLSLKFIKKYQTMETCIQLCQ